MRRYQIARKQRWLAVSLLIAALSGTFSGCSLPDGFAGIIRPVEEVVSTVRQNMELREQMNALELPRDVKSISTGRYAYETLPAEEKKIYDQMLDAVINHDEEVTLSTSDGRHLEDIFNCLKADYGGLFWVESFRYTQYQRNGQTEVMSFAPNYIMTAEEREEMQNGY